MPVAAEEEEHEEEEGNEEKEEKIGFLVPFPIPSKRRRKKNNGKMKARKNQRTYVNNLRG